MREQIKSLLNRVLTTHSPGGWEQEMDALIRDHWSRGPHAVHQDPHGNIYVRISGQKGGPLTLICAHKDEISFMVRQIDDDGKIWLEPIGGSCPFKYGEGPFDIITAAGVVEGILCVASSHISELSTRMYKSRTAALTWDMVYLDCKLSRSELLKQGVMVGDYAVIGRRRKPPMYIHDEYVCGYALDDKAAVVILLILADRLKEQAPLHDLCLAMTASEEGTSSGAQYICRQTGPFNVIAVETAPIAEEYPIKMSAQPVVIFKDSDYHYSPELSRDLIAAGRRCGVECQRAVVRSFGCDASTSAKAGLCARAACIGFPTENTHGYEITPLTVLENCINVLSEYCVRGGVGQQ